MQLTHLKLTNFRNYENLNLTFSKNINIIYGKNGTGKTNLIEAIYLLALTKSFRVNNDKIMIRKGCNNLDVEGKIKTIIDTYYKVIIDKTSKKVAIDHNKKERISDYISNINIILFHPEDTKIIKEAPSERRKLLNIEISKIYKEYLLLLTSYNKILKHRNSYLKELYINGNASLDYLEILTKKLISIGFRIFEYRDDFVEKINKYIADIYLKIFSYGNLEVKYVSNYKNKTEEDILLMYKKIYRKEIEVGKTLIGIHHDDLIFLLDKNKLKEWGSIGQLKNSIISFKLAEISMLKEIEEKQPILILDDLFSELDNEKVNNILDILNKEIQTFITTTAINNLDLKKFNNFKIFKVENESIKEEICE